LIYFQEVYLERKMTLNQKVFDSRREINVINYRKDTPHNIV